MFAFFKSTQKRPSEIKQQQARKRRAIESGVVSTITRGNVSLQNGEYITQEDMDDLHKKLLAFFSSDESKW